MEKGGGEELQSEQSLQFQCVRSTTDILLCSPLLDLTFFADRKTLHVSQSSLKEHESESCWPFFLTQHHDFVQ